MSYINNKFKKFDEQISINQSSLGFQKKNLLMNNCKDASRNGVNAKINKDGSITLTGISTVSDNFQLYSNVQLGIYAGSNISQYTNNKKWIPNGNYIVSGGHADASVQVRVAEESGVEGSGYGSRYGEQPFSVTEKDKYVWSRIVVYNGFNHPEGITLFPMIRDARITDSTYEPYQPGLQEQINIVTMGVGKPLEEGQDLNDMKEPGVYMTSKAVTTLTLINCPFKIEATIRLEVSLINTDTCIIQKIFPNSKKSGFYLRVFNNQSWGNWFRFVGEEVIDGEVPASD